MTSPNRRPGLARFVATELLAYARNAGLTLLGPRPPHLNGESGPVVLMVHGHGSGPGPFASLAQSLAAAGFRRAVAWSYQSTGGVADLGADLDRFVRTRLGGARLLVVGHSLGGILARWWIQEQGGRAQTDALVTLSTPHRGISRIPGAGWLPVVRDIVAGSAILRRLAETERGLEGLPGLSIVSTRDHFVRGWQTASFHGARLVPVAHVGHVGVLFCPSVHRLVAEHFRGDGRP